MHACEAASRERLASMTNPAVSEKAPSQSDLKNTGYEIFIGALSVLSIVNLILLYVIQDASLDVVLYSINILLTLTFLGDFLFRLTTARSKSHYFFRNFGWADLLASLPFQQAKILRLFRLVKVVRLLKEKGAKNVGRSLVKDRAGSALLSLLLVAILMLEFGSLFMLHIEADAPDANITNASDALWYVIVTMSTVGYGDEYPITNAGRLLGTCIIIIGVGIFGTLTGYLANAFLSPRRAKSKEVEQGEDPDIEVRINALKALMEQQQSALAALEATISKER